MNYFDEAIQSGKKRIWTHLKDINSECKSSIKCVEINGQKIENTKQICECLNNHDSRKTNITDRKFNASSPKVGVLRVFNFCLKFLRSSAPIVSSSNEIKLKKKILASIS
jgi:hypothetical protein